MDITNLSFIIFRRKEKRRNKENRMEEDDGTPKNNV